MWFQASKREEIGLLIGKKNKCKRIYTRRNILAAKLCSFWGGPVAPPEWFKKVKMAVMCVCKKGLGFISAATTAVLDAATVAPTVESY